MSWKRKDAKKLIEGVQDGSFTNGRLPEHLFNFTANELTNAFTEGWSGLLDIESPDLRLAQSFQENLWYFAANKTAKNVELLNDLIFDKNGKARSTDKIIEEALKIDSKLNVNWIESEVNTTVRLAQSGREWQQIEATKDSFPLLEFVSVNDSNTRPAHAERDGITLPVDHPFWEQNQPPLDHQCRCTTKQVRRGKVTPEESVKDIPSPPPLFRHNVLKSRKVWANDKHPFGQNLSKEQKQAAKDLVDNAMKYSSLFPKKK